MDATKHTPLTLAEACKLISRFLKPEAGFVWTAVVYGIAVALLGLAVPVSVQLLINSVANTALPAPLFVLSGLLLGLLLAAALLSAARIYVLALFERRVFARTVADITLRALHARNPHSADAGRGDLFNRFFDLMTVQKAVPHLLVGGFAILLQSGIGLVLTSFYHPFFLAFNLVAAAVLVASRSSGRDRRSGPGVALSHAKHETARWLEIIGSFERLSQARRSTHDRAGPFRGLTSAYVQSHRPPLPHTFAQAVGFLMVYAIASAGLLAMGGWLILQGQLSLGQLVAAELVLSSAFYGISQLGTHARTFYDLVASLHELSLFEGIEQADGDGWNGPRPANGNLRLRDAEADGLRFDFAVENGEVLAVAADEGVERTLAALLERRIRPQRGWVIVGGADIAAFGAEALRSGILVLDQSTLPETSIREYLSAGDGACPVRIHGCLEQVGLAERIRSLPYGLDTPLSASGSPLSTDEAVALKLAAALLQPPKLVVLSVLLDLLPPDRVAVALAGFPCGGHHGPSCHAPPPMPVHDDLIRLGPHGYGRAAEREGRLEQAMPRERTHAVAA